MMGTVGQAGTGTTNKARRESRASTQNRRQAVNQH
jgi:hypothetical protein